MFWSTGAALASAALFAGTTNLQRVAASSVAPRGPVHLVRRLATDRRWLAGGLIGAVALGLHALALSLGSVMVVQSVMALGLLMALGFEAVREHRRLLPRKIAGALFVVVGVATVVVLSRPATDATVVTVPLLLAGAGVAVATSTAVVRSRHEVGQRWAARWLAAGAGACFAVDAVFLQRLAAAAGPLLHRHASGEDLVAAIVGAVGFLASSAVGGIAVHRAYQVAPLRSVQPALAAAEPVTAFVLGVGVLGDGVIGGAAGFALLVTGFAAITAGILLGLPEPAGVAQRVPPGQVTNGKVTAAIQPNASARTATPAAVRAASPSA
jgi:drug/metabolite transporter (DMT)-like permease